MMNLIFLNILIIFYNIINNSLYGIALHTSLKDFK